MPEFPSASYTWASVAIAVIWTLFIYISSVIETKKERKKNIADAKAQYKEALEEKTPEQIIAAKRKLNRAKRGKTISLVILACFLTTGCASNVDSYIPVGDYIRTPVEGDVVPALPEGEKRWILMSVPTGSDLLIERD